MVRRRRIVYDRLPKPLRPKWAEWKKLCQIFKDPMKAEMALLSQAIKQLEKHESSTDRGTGG